MRTSLSTVCSIVLVACGQMDDDFRLGAVEVDEAAIVGGTATFARPEVGRIVWTTSSGQELTCTATLIAQRLALTANHCLLDFASGDFVLTVDGDTEIWVPIIDRRTLSQSASTFGGGPNTLDGYSGDVALVRLASSPSLLAYTPMEIADKLPASGSAWSTRFGYGGDDGLKRYRSFQGLTSTGLTENGDSGGPVKHDAGTSTGALWAINHGANSVWNTDIDANMVYFKLQVEGHLLAWSGQTQLGVDRYGGDYDIFPAGVTGYQACAGDCANDSRCASWAYAGGNCYLKEIIPNWRPVASVHSGLNPNRGSGQIAPIGWNRAGGDYSVSTLSSWSTCPLLCAQDERCRAYAVTATPPYVCHLKDRAPSPVPDANYRSAAKRGFEVDTDRYGSDYRSFTIDRHAPERCQAECEKDSFQCRAWSYVLATPTAPSICFLKGSIPAPSFRQHTISGRRGWSYY